MSFDEKSAWVMGFVSVVAYGVYLAVVLSGAGGGPLVQAPYVGALLWSIGGALIAAIAAHIAIAIAAPKEADKRDQRDREIHRFGEYVGQSFVVIGGVAAMLMALAELAHFWIANAIYLGFVLSAVLGSVTKIVAYRRGLPSW